MNVKEIQEKIRDSRLTVSQVFSLASPEAREIICSNTATKNAPDVVILEIEKIVKYLSDRSSSTPGSSRIPSSKIKVSKINSPNPNITNHDDTIPTSAKDHIDVP